LKTDSANGCSEWSPVEFLALISHELRSPIQAIFGWAEIVDSVSIDPVWGVAQRSLFISYSWRLARVPR